MEGVAFARRLSTPRRRRPWYADKPPAREPGDLHRRPRRSWPGRCRKGLAVVDNERDGEVGGSEEAGEQNGLGRFGARGANGRGQGECGTAKHGPDAESGSRVTGAAPLTRSRHRERTREAPLHELYAHAHARLARIPAGGAAQTRRGLRPPDYRAIATARGKTRESTQSASAATPWYARVKHAVQRAGDTLLLEDLRKAG